MPTPIDVNSPLTLDALDAAVRAADPAARVVPAWLMQKVIAHDTGTLTGVFGISRAQAHVIARDRLLDIAAREELPIEPPPADATTLILLARPEADVLSGTPGPDLLLRYWRLIFHARVRATVTARLSSPKSAALHADLSPRAAVQRRIERVGRPVFNEARFVLQRERHVPAWADDAETYAEFAAVYLELTHFAPEPLAWYFPAVTDPMSVLTVLAEDVDAESLRRNTRPSGATDPHAGGLVTSVTGSASGNKRPARVRRDAAHREKLLATAERADSVRNDVRAAIFRMRVYRASGTPGPTPRDGSGPSTATVYADALRDLDQLVARLNAALHLGDAQARQWRAWLVALLENAASGWWNAEGRLLYDLQKVCVYHEREIYSVNVVDFVLERGKRPLRRPQPGQRLVLIVKALRTALRRTARARLSPHGRSELARLLRAAVHDAEERLRAYLRPGVTSALDQAGLHPANPAESVAHAKLVEELLDDVVDGGYLTFGAVRDAVSRNQMKLDDLTRVGDLAGLRRAQSSRGDQLLRLDRRLEENLDYVYRHGEIYLRTFHRLSSLFFATDAGRLITRALILPFGGAYLVLEALDHSVGLLIHKLAAKQYVVTAAAASAGQAFGPTPVATPASHKMFNHWWVLLLLGAFLFALINAPAFRHAVARGFRRLWAAVRAVFIDLPHWLATQPAVRALFKSHFARLLTRYVFKPLVVAAVVYALLPPDVGRRHRMFTLAGVFMGVNVALNSRAGRAFEQRLLHSLRTTFARLTWDVIASIIRRIVQVFQGVLEAIDRLLYAVDEMLRFRDGQKRSAVVTKAILGVCWFYVAYLTRFIINLLVEPQINPIKHFPVVTVSHKMILPTTPYISAAFQRIGVEAGAAWTTAGLITLCSPGIFGFLAWEFKENWKLYKANRSAALKPVRAGSHGESLAQFLRPGLHSGTIPKIFHKLRKSHADPATPASTARHLESAHHVHHALVAFFEREFIALLNQHPLFKDTPVTLGPVHLASTLIRVEFDLKMSDAALSATPLTLSFEQRAAWVIAGVDEPGWTTDLSPDRAQLLAAALLGLYKMAGADIVREHVASLFPADTKFDFRRNDLVVWPTPDFTVEATYPITDDRPLTPHYTDGARTAVALPTLQPHDILFRKVPLPRTAWIQLWQSRPNVATTTPLPSVQPTAPFPTITVLPPRATEPLVTQPLFEVARATSP
jgi:hypothetical protein